MKAIFLFISFIFLFFVSKGQYVNNDSLIKYSKPEEQEKIFNAQAKHLKLNPIKAIEFKRINYFYAAKSLNIVKDESKSWYSRGMELKEIKTQHSNKMKTLLTQKEFILWVKERNKNGIIKRIII